MGITIAELVGDRKEIWVPPLGAEKASRKESLRVVYRPGYQTAEYDELIARPGTTSAGWITAILASVIEWDLELTKGEPVPLTEEGLRPVPYRLLAHIVRKTWDDLSNGAGKGSASD